MTYSSQRVSARRAASSTTAFVRHGALALLAGLDVRTGQVFASTPKTTGIVPFMDLVAQVMARPRYWDAPRVFVIVDNGSDHRGKGRHRPAPQGAPQTPS